MKIYLPFLLCVVGLVSSLTQAQSRPPAKVLVEPISFAPIEVSIETVGTAEAVKSVSLFPAAADRVTAVLFTPGDFVEKGTLLVELDARRQRASLLRAKIELADRERELSRLEKSKANGAITQSELDEARSFVELAKVSVAEAQANLDDRQVLAPISGYLGLTDVEVGDRINQSTLITTIDKRDQLYINFLVPESAVGLVGTKTQVKVQAWNNRGDVLNASLAQLDSRINTEDRTLKVRALLNNQDDKYRPGLSFKVNLNAKGAEYPIVPEASLAWGATGSHVWIEENGKAVKKKVEIKQRLRGYILVEGDLDGGDTLIVEGIQRLREGAAVSGSSLMAEK
ncbi:MAG: efflux RND transporter periplasmic adaptor subunit [Gammaproteobacteria bacterium]|nr:efflux RND transporter periplasmic adaptor subunit [Gammaproteobacteria bacterium]